MRAGLWLCLVLVACAQPSVPSPSATVTPTAAESRTPTPSPQSYSPTVTPTGSPISRSATPSPQSESPTPSVTPSPYASLGRGCARDRCITGSCQADSRCCGGFCILSIYVPKTLAIGATCDPGGSACALCGIGTTCDPFTSKCMVYGIGYACPSRCLSNADCIGGLTCTGAGKCGFTGLSVGATCNADTAICSSGLTCTSNVCTPVAGGSTCTASNAPYDPTSAMNALVNYLDGACVNTHYCSQSVCVAKRSAGTACTRHAECVRGICNSGFCAEPNSVASQQACTVSEACASGLFCGGGACQPRVPAGMRCTQSSVLPYDADCTPLGCPSDWCTTGLMCSNTDGRPTCQFGNRAPGETCSSSDQCGPNSAWGCLTRFRNDPFGVCSGSSAGDPCSPNNSTTCGTVLPSQCQCSVTDGSSRGVYECAPATTPPSPCAALYARALGASWSAGYYAASPSGGLFAHIAVGGGNNAIDYICCEACDGSSLVMEQGLINQYAAIFGRLLYCGTSTAGPPFSGTVRDNVCAATSGDTGQTIPVQGYDVFGACPGASLSPGMSPAPSSTPSISPTVSLSSSTTASPSWSSSITPTISLTSSVTPTISLTVSLTPTVSITPTPVPASPDAGPTGMVGVVTGLAITTAALSVVVVAAAAVIFVMYRKLARRDAVSDYDRAKNPAFTP